MNNREGCFVYRIKISEEIKEIASDYRENLFTNRRDGFVHPIDKLDDLNNKLKRDNDPVFENSARKYLEKIIRDFSKNLDALPSTFQNIIDDYEKILPKSELSKKVSYDGVEKEFYKHIVDAMRYDDLGPEIYPLFDKLHLKACVYCNIQTAIFEGKSVNYTLDHFYCKSQHPYLCLSFFNLYPCCPRCNEKKSYNESKDFFELYVEDDSEQDPFVFKIVKDSLKSYVNNDNCHDAIILFRLRHGYAPKMISKLEIESLYRDDIAKDFLENVLNRARDYDFCNVNITNDTFEFRIDNTTIAERQLKCILGKYISIKDVHRAIGTKLVIDFAKELGILH